MVFNRRFDITPITLKLETWVYLVYRITIKSREFNIFDDDGYVVTRADTGICRYTGIYETQVSWDSGCIYNTNRYESFQLIFYITNL